jgi:cytochrome-b5 reductase
LPTCIKVIYNPKDDDDADDEEKTTPGGEMTTTVVRARHHRRLEKSYSPISHPAVGGYFDLIVKSYPPSSRTRGGGGVGRYLCDMSIGEYMYGAVKPDRVVHGRASVLGRWTNVGLVAGGTGIAPLLQIARIILDSSSRDDDADTTKTIVRLLFFNRREEDILAREEIEDMVRMHPTRFIVSYSLTDEKCVPDGWTGHVGRGDISMISSSLPPPTGGAGKTMIFVCGTDGFVSALGGPVVRAPPPPPDDRTDGEEEGGNNKERRGGKIQGPLLGLLREAGYAEEEVFKY